MSTQTPHTFTTARPKRSDLYGYRHSDDDSLVERSNKVNSHAPPLAERLAELFEEVKVNDPPAQGRMEHGGDPPTKGMGTRFAPHVQQQRGRMNEHYGQIDPESDPEFFRNKMNGTTKRVAGAASTKRPINLNDAAYTQAVQQWGHQVQGAKTSSMQQGVVHFGSSATHQVDTSSEPSRPRSILRNKNPPETATQVSRASSASFFGNARSKLRGYLSTFKHKKHPTANQSETQSEAGGGGYISSTKNPRYRQSPQGSHSYSPGYSTGVAQSVTSGDGISYTSTVHHYDAASLSSKHSKNSKNSKSKKAKNKLSRKLDQDNPNKSIQIQVFDLPWSDGRPNSHLRGRYSGPVSILFLIYIWFYILYNSSCVDSFITTR